METILIMKKIKEYIITKEPLRKFDLGVFIVFFLITMLFVFTIVRNF